LYSSKLYSHPDKPLEVHLQNVAQSCLSKFRSIPHHLAGYMPMEYWEKLIWLMGFSHDLGKATSYFQTYLFEKNEQNRMEMKNKPETGHSLISAVIGFWIAKKYVNSKGNDYLQNMPFLIYLAIKKHHGNINNAIRIGESDESNELDVPCEHLDRQWEAIDKIEMKALIDEINRNLSLQIDCVEFPESLTYYFKRELVRKEKNRYRDCHKQLDDYFIFQFLYSLLLHSDKEDAIFGIRPKIPRIAIPTDTVKKYKIANFKDSRSNINRIRNAIFDDAERYISEINLDHKILSLNVPTGSGKTLTALSVALALRKRLEEAGGSCSRIIYGLPYTSIIDQNFDVYQKLFKCPNSNLLLKHHHLAEIAYRIGNHEAEFEALEARFLIESWESEIIITTFFQIFHTIFTNRNRMIQKFNKLANSIIL